MPRKTLTGLPHTKTVKRRGVEYVYFNTGQKIDGKPVYVPLGRKDAVELGNRYSAAKMARTKRDGTSGGFTVPQLVIRFERSPDFTKKSLGTQRTYSVYLRRLATEFDTAPANKLETSDLLELMDEMGERPAAVDMMILAGKQMFDWAVARKNAIRNPFDGIGREDWTRAEYEPWPEVVVEAALEDARLRLPVALLYFTAQRIGDVCAMRWDAIDDGTIHVIQQKTKAELAIPIHSRLAAILESAERRGDTILADAKGAKVKDGTIRSWIKAFGIDHGVTLVPHGLRKNAVNALLEAECSTAETSAISGQSLRMIEHYAKKRNRRRTGKAAMSKWERSGNRETAGKPSEETAEK